MDGIISVWLQEGASHIWIDNKRAKPHRLPNGEKTTGRTFFYPSMASVKRAQRLQIKMIEEKQL